MAKEKVIKLQSNLFIRSWFKNFKVISTLIKDITKQSIFMEYYYFRNIGFTKLLINRLVTWLAIWENLIYQTKQFNVAFENWLTNIGLIQQSVLGITSYFDKIKQKIIQKTHYKYLLKDISPTI